MGVEFVRLKDAIRAAEGAGRTPEEALGAQDEDTGG
jgi:hypothetical protein